MTKIASFILTLSYSTSSERWLSTSKKIFPKETHMARTNSKIQHIEYNRTVRTCPLHEKTHFRLEPFNLKRVRMVLMGASFIFGNKVIVSILDHQLVSIVTEIHLFLGGLQTNTAWYPWPPQHFYFYRHTRRVKICIGRMVTNFLRFLLFLPVVL